MDRTELRSAFDEQVRRHPEDDAPDAIVERGHGVVRSISRAGGWTGVTWTELGAEDADETIAAQIRRFGELSGPWEWKHYSDDRPADLAERLTAAGFTAEPAETLLVAPIDELSLDVSPPPGIELRPVVDDDDIAALVAVGNAVFGGDHRIHGATLATALGRYPPAADAVIAWAAEQPVAAGRVEYRSAGGFAGLWGGGTLAAWRGRGIFRSVIAHRARLARERGFSYLFVDASAQSRPILERLGFVALATTTPFAHPGSAEQGGERGDEP
jgi:GNAT superfamily N-acetyltransferase